MLLCFSISNASLRSPSTSFGLVKLTEGRFFFFFSSRRRHTRWNCDWSSDVCSSDLGEPVEHVTPDTTFKIENPVAVLNTSKHKAQAEAFVKFLYTDAGQRAWAQAGFRPVNQQVAQEFAQIGRASCRERV